MTGSSPLVSVVLPFYNAEATLRRALDSVAKQSFQDFECIMVDNNSTDQSPRIANRYVHHDRRFRLVSEQQKGVVHASNRGCTLAKGKYIARMDADDESLSNRLKQQVDFLENHPEMDAVGGKVIYGSGVKGRGFDRYVNWVNSIDSEEKIHLMQFVEMPVVNPSMMWRALSAERFELYREGPFPEDYEMWLRWLNGGARITKIPQKILRWHDNPARLTRTHERYSEEAFFKVKSEYLARWLAENNPFHPDVVVWGASRQSRKNATLLENHGINIRHYIDIKAARDIRKPVIHYQNLPSPESAFILVYVKLPQAQRQILEYLTKSGYREGKNYLLAS